MLLISHVVLGLLRVPVQPVRLLRGDRLHQRDGAHQVGGDASARHLRAAVCAAT